MFVGGLLLMLAGAGLLFWAGLIGVEVSSGLRVANFAGLAAGAAAFVGGSAMVAGAKITEALESLQTQLLDQFGLPLNRIPSVTETEADEVGYDKTGQRKKKTIYSFRGIKYMSLDEAESARDEFVEAYGRTTERDSKEKS